MPPHSFRDTYLVLHLLKRLCAPAPGRPPLKSTEYADLQNRSIFSWSEWKDPGIRIMSFGM
jgi:hypothetical protein